ncbi:substrate-binding domain-containing protein [Desulfofarcimen acetoxidans]|uniref:substrate-binding domain-containing protein n=1 Tax=Desulfofarcimen acetoxidans TaxID=58138 RepID=UPI0005A92548|nr:substrate-binding domain-containing protein [Desulfofarcimen acetoxidans]
MWGSCSRKVLLPVIFFVAFLLTGCPDKGEQKPVSQKVKIGVCLADMERDGNRIIKKIMTERAQKEGISFTWQDAGNDAEKQQEQINELVKKKVKAVILQAVDPSAGPAIARTLTEKGIKTVALETLPANTPLDAYVASDHGRVGELQARYALEQSAAGGKTEGLRILVLQGDPSDLAAREITAANEAVLKGDKRVADLKVQSNLRADPGLARVAVENTLAAGKLDAVLANDSRLAMAAVQVLTERNLAAQVVTVGVGADSKSVRGIASGQHDAEVDNSPELLAQYITDAAVELAKTGHWQYTGHVPNGQYDVATKITPVRLITMKDLYLLGERASGSGGGNEQNDKSDQQSGGSSHSGEKQGGGEQGGSGENSGDQGGSGGQSQSGAQGQSGKRKTTLKITTQDGKTMEVELNGEIKSIESKDGGGRQSSGDSQQSGGANVSSGG